MLKSLRRHFLVGTLTIAPFAVTAYLIYVVGAWFDGQFQPLIRLVLEKAFGLHGGYIPGLGILVGVLVVVAVGWLAPSFLGRHTFAASERFIQRIPLVKAVFAAAKQVFEAFSSSGGTERFRQVVAVNFPCPASYALGFVTADQPGGWFPGKPNVKLAVFVPTTPLPTNGYLLFVDERETIALPLSVEDGIKLVVSAALAQPSGTVVNVTPSPI